MKIAIIPQPKHVVLHPGVFCVNAQTRLLLASKAAQEDLFAFQLLNHDLNALPNLRLKIQRATAVENGPANSIVLDDADHPKLGAEGYSIEITPATIRLSSADSAGRFYAIQSLRQLVRQFQGELPCLTIQDRPAFAKRGILLDVTRGKVPTLDTLKMIVEKLGFYKINVLSLYIEHVFAFKKHPEISRGASPLTSREILLLDAHCRKYHIELIPSLASFGHMENVLKLPKYRHLAETDGEKSVAPANPLTYRLLEDLYSEFLPLFSSSYFNACCDEVGDIGMGQSKTLVEEIGREGIYCRHIRKLKELARKYGKEKIMIWGDMFAPFNPTALSKTTLGTFPKDLTVLNWYYGSDKDHEMRESNAKLKNADVAYFVCPSTCAWTALFARLDNALGNIRKFIEYGKKDGAVGAMCTDWGDYGHINFLGHSWLQFIYAAQKSWNFNDHDEDFVASFSRQFFGVESDRLAQAIQCLGRTFEACGFTYRKLRFGDYMLFFETTELEPSLRFDDFLDQMQTRNLKHAIRLAQQALKVFRHHRSKTDDRVTMDEFIFACRQTVHMASKALLLKRLRQKTAFSWTMRRKCLAEQKRLQKDLFMLRKEFRRLWLLRNKQSNLQDNLDKYDRVLRNYAERIKAMRKGATLLEKRVSFAPGR